LPRRIVANQRRQGPVQSREGSHHPLPISRGSHPCPLADHRVRPGATEPLRDLWRAGCPANGHVQFGKRPGETGRSKGRNRAPGRLHRGLRCLGERGFALLTERWKALEHVTISPRRITQIARAALVLVHFEHGLVN
jgi:hypothetical protein